MWPGRAADHSPPSSAAVMEEYSYTSTNPLGHTGPVTGSLYLFTYCQIGVLLLCNCIKVHICRSQWPCGLRRRSAAARLLRL